MEKKKSKIGKIVKRVLIVYLALGALGLLLVSLPDGKKKTNAGKKEKEAAKVEQKATEKPLEWRKANSGLTQEEKITNPLIVYCVGNKRPYIGGYAQVIAIMPQDWKKITGKQLFDFWRECNFDGWKAVLIMENDSGWTGRGLQITQGGKFARLGFLGVGDNDFGNVKEEARQFWFYADEGRFQYFNATDAEDAPLRDLKDDDKPLEW